MVLENCDIGASIVNGSMGTMVGLAFSEEADCAAFNSMCANFKNGDPNAVIVDLTNVVTSIPVGVTVDILTGEGHVRITMPLGGAPNHKHNFSGELTCRQLGLSTVTSVTARVKKPSMAKSPVAVKFATYATTIAFAITLHKLQSLTCPKLILDLNKPPRPIPDWTTPIIIL